MKTLYKYHVLFSFLMTLCFGNCLFAERTIRNADSTEYISKTFLVGAWETEDSFRYKIRFGYKGMDFNLIQDSSFSYSFSNANHDSSLINQRGWAPNWPPYYAEVHKLDKDHISVEFWCITQESRLRYVFGRQ